MKWFRNEEMLKGILEDNKKELKKTKENKYYWLLKDETNLIQDHLELMADNEKLIKIIKILKNKPFVLEIDLALFEWDESEQWYYFERENAEYDINGELWLTHTSYTLTKEEYELLKEVLGND